jgi:hypothetical protein
MLRWLATATIAVLFALVVMLPRTDLGRRGTEAHARADVDGAVGAVGERLPDITWLDLDTGSPLRLADLRGQRVVLTFERSVDW